MDARQAPPEQLPGIRSIQLRRSPAHPGKCREAKLIELEQCFAADLHRGRHRQLSSRHFRGKLMLFGDLVIRPALRTIEFQHEVAARTAQLIHPVLVAVEREEAAIDIEAY